MYKFYIKVMAFLLILFTYKLGFCQLTLENIFLKQKYAPIEADDIQFLHKKPLYAKFEDTKSGKNIVLFDISANKKETIKLTEYKTENNIWQPNWHYFSISNNDTYFLLESETEYLYRRTKTCSYYLFDNKNNIKALSTDKQQLPLFSPDDKKIAFIKSNNLFYKDLLSGEEIQVTFDGKWNSIINGKSDWVYEEEFEATRLYEWNAQSTKIAYLKFDETNVKEYQIPYYYDLTYPTIFSYKYPKVGEENSQVSLCIFDVKKKKNQTIKIPFSYEYIPRIYWNATGDEVVYMLLNRHQDSLRLISYNVKTKLTRQLYFETNNCYVEIPNSINFLTDNSFLITSEKDGFNHLYHYDENGKLKVQITSGKFEVKEIYGVDEQSKKIFYKSNEGNEIETQLFSINYQTLEKTKLSTQNGTNNAVFSTDFSYFLHLFSAAQIAPKISLVQTKNLSATIIENNQSLQDSLKSIPQKKFLKIWINNDSLNAFLIQPNSIDSTKKNPLLMFVYGGPNHVEVENKWQLQRDLFFNFLAENGYTVACVDNHGASGKGVAFKKSIFLHLGKKETDDQIAAARYFGNLETIDSNRIGIFGWSYGGFLAANCLFEGNTVFKSALAIAPVTDWKMYDNIYTERYMHTPEENPSGYLFNPNSIAKNLKGNLFLAHGMTDDNVHFQNTLYLINALNEAHKNYQLYIYPDKAHGIGNRQDRFDLYLKMYDFLKTNL
ncbi:MAG TPA: S9 family peptidase [Chitinophagales bacterium]|nr:S9 family peptidase [Chitinophagales bacterium]